MHRRLPLLSLSLLFAFAPAHANSLAADGWVLNQSNDDYGAMVTKVTPFGVRIDTPEHVILITPPNYPLFIMNTKTKRFLDRPTSSFARYDDYRSLLSFVKDGETEICGLKATKYISRSEKQNPNDPYCMFWVARGLVPDKLSDACLTLMSVVEMPPGHRLGLPLRAWKIGPRGPSSHFTYMDTDSVRRAFIPASEFKRPTGYRRVNDLMELGGEALTNPKATDADVSGLFEEAPTSRKKPVIKDEAHGKQKV